MAPAAPGGTVVTSDPHGPVLNKAGADAMTAEFHEGLYITNARSGFSCTLAPGTDNGGRSVATAGRPPPV